MSISLEGFLKTPHNAFSSSVPKAIRFFNSGSRDFRIPPKSEYVDCVFFSRRSTGPIIVGHLPSSLRRNVRRWYEIGVTLYGSKSNVGSTVKGRYSTGLQQNRFTEIIQLSVRSHDAKRLSSNSDVTNICSHWVPSLDLALI